jgi:fengycin family lipopeptide synthetase A
MDYSSCASENRWTFVAQKHEVLRIMNTETLFYDLSQPQKSIWYLEKKHPNTSMNSICATLRLKGQIDYDLLAEAVQRVIEKNDAIRTRIVEYQGEASQYFAPYEEKEIDVFDFRAGEGMANLFAWDEAQNKIPIQIIDSDLYYFALIKISDNEGAIYSKMHHLMSDAWTMNLVGNMIMLYYTALKNGEEVDHSPNPSFAEHLLSEQKYEQSDRCKIDAEYWNKKFENYPEPTILKSKALTTSSIISRRKSLWIPQKLSHQMRAYCSANGISVFTLFMSALAIYIYRVTGNEDQILGTTVMNRVNAREKNTPGMFVSIAAPIRIGINDTMDFRTFADGMTKELVAVLRHQKYPYNYLVRDLHMKHKMQDRLFDIVLNYQNANLLKKSSQEELVSRWHFSGHQTESLVIHVNDRDDDGTFLTDYDYLTDVYNIKEIEYIHQHVVSLLWHAIDNPSKPIALLEILSDKEKHKILSEFNHTIADFPRDKTLPLIFEEQVERTPDHTAVICGDQHMTYQELNERSNQLARVLRSHGVKAESVVGLSVYRSFEMVIAIMGIMKAGGAYLPMDPDYPEDRIKYMIENSQTQILLTQKNLMEQFAYVPDLLDLEDPNNYAEDASNLEAVNGPDDLAYVIYTSGSTGRPKGVMIEQRGIVNRIHWMQKKYPIGPDDVILQKTTYTFDVSVWELFWWSFAGAKLCMLAPEGEKDPGVIIAAVEKYKVTTMHFVPSMLSAFLSYAEKAKSSPRLSSLIQVFCDGEVLTMQHTILFNHLLHVTNGTKLINLYGPTEASVDVSYFDCSPSVTLHTVPIGKPIDNIRLYVLDRNQLLLPVGIPGELYIAGVGVARGYMNNPELTAEKFVPDPFFPGEIMYRTGDRVRWFPQGDIEFFGRIDFQVKIRGFRIELGEIENRIQSHPSVKDVVVVGTTHNNNSILCAYYVTDAPVPKSELREYLLQVLPDYMVPSYFLAMDALPQTSNGKVNRKALPPPDYEEVTEEEYLAPDNPTESELVESWCRLLEITKVGVNENFFHIGGDSLRAIALITEVRKSFQIEMSVRDVFKLQNIRDMAAYVMDAQKSNRPCIPVCTLADCYPMSSSQRRLYVLNQMDPDDTSYHLPGCMLIEGSLNREKVQNSFTSLIQRHESLRTIFGMNRGLPVQRILHDVPFEVSFSESDEKDIPAVFSDFVRPFDLGTAPLLCVHLVKIGQDRHIMMFDMHHIISDGASINILIREFADLYHGKDLPDLHVTYKDYSAMHTEWMASDQIKEKEKYWTDIFSGEIPILNMPTDFPRPTRKSHRGQIVSSTLSEKDTSNLRQQMKKTDTTLFMMLLAAYQVLLSKYTSQDDIIVGIPVEGRLHADLQNIIGVFVNTLAIRSHPAGDKTFLQFLEEVKTELLQSYEHQEYPFEVLVDKVKPARDVGRNPLFDTVFVLQNMDTTKLQLTDMTISSYPASSHTAKFDMTTEAIDRGASLTISTEYCTDLFTEESMHRFLEHYSRLLSSVAAHPEKRIADLDVLSEEEKTKLLVSFQDTDAIYPTSATVHSIFEEQAAADPDRIAVIFEDASLTYGELNAKANQLAVILRQNGVTPDAVVGISIHRSLEMIIGIFAILKSGGAYLPMDPDYPEERIQYMLADSGAVMLLAGRDLMNRLQTQVKMIDIDDPGVYSGNTSNLIPVNHAGHLAYIIYTSGSTGHPKGVMIEHRNVVRLLRNDRFQFRFSEKDVWTMFHSFCFDFSVWEMYGALMNGGTLIVVSKEAARDTRLFLRIVKKHNVTVLNQTPAAFMNLMQEELTTDDASLHLRYVIFGGEALKPAMLRPFHAKYPQTLLVNMYGITETTVHVTYKEIGPEEMNRDTSNIGRAIPTLKTYVLDANLHLQPIGVPGELCVSGDGVGRGYVNNEVLTSRKFISNPFDPHTVLYRSGDLAKVQQDGDLVYLGRIDSQVKIRGYRIELGEIESVLYRYPGISEVIVIPKETAAGEKRLYAYYVASTEIHASEIRAALLLQLPEYMIPTFFFQLPAMPLNRNGKIDRSALQRIELAIHLDVVYVAPTTDCQITLAAIWSDILEVPKIGIHDDFFSLGGNSLNAIKMMSGLSEHGYSVSLTDIYTHATIHKLSEWITDAHRTGRNPMLIRLTSSEHTLPEKTRSDKTVMVCFPYGGGNAIAYKALADAVQKQSDDYIVFGVNVPGHDVGSDEELLSVPTAAQLLFDEISTLQAQNLILYGHCVGNALLVATALLLESKGIKLLAVYTGANFPPKYAGLYGSYIDPWKLRSDEQIIAYLNQIGLPPTSMENDYTGLILKAFRHDAKSYYRYFSHISSNNSPKIRAPLYCVIGEEDAVTKNYQSKYRKWSMYANHVHLRVLSGANHYFLTTNADELAAVLIENVAKNVEKRTSESIHTQI